MGTNNNLKHINDVMNESVADSKSRSSMKDLNDATHTLKTGYFYQNETFVDVKGILGQVFVKWEFKEELETFIFPIEAPLDEDSILKNPEKKAELIIDNKVKTNADVLKFINIDISGEELLEVNVIKNAVARVKDKSNEWQQAVTKWEELPRVKLLINDPLVEAITIVRGVAQNYLTTKIFKKFEAAAKGGWYGVNVEGNLYTSTSQSDLSVVYELDLATYYRRRFDFEGINNTFNPIQPPGFFSNFGEIKNEFTIMEFNQLFSKSKNRF